MDCDHCLKYIGKIYRYVQDQSLDFLGHEFDKLVRINYLQQKEYGVVILLNLIMKNKQKYVKTLSFIIHFEIIPSVFNLRNLQSFMVVTPLLFRYVLGIYWL